MYDAMYSTLALASFSHLRDAIDANANANARKKPPFRPDDIQLSHALLTVFDAAPNRVP